MKRKGINPSGYGEPEEEEWLKFRGRGREKERKEGEQVMSDAEESIKGWREAVPSLLLSDSDVPVL